ncbi:hypothetical protein HMPREF9240_00289 [Winkia neuii BV029A5]|uniref:Uncharacterized protein n=1 Tax=Winkia neuii BV029A5 TaxID=888439 RepID=K0ZJS1_9ACTO|nr:hypothetical protein HMPREF9240_00289 [Winkia neuii BV029A5]
MGAAHLDYSYAKAIRTLAGSRTCGCQYLFMQHNAATAAALFKRRTGLCRLGQGIFRKQKYFGSFPKTAHLYGIVQAAVPEN